MLLPDTARLLNHATWSLISSEITRDCKLIQPAQSIEPALQQYILEYNHRTQDIQLKDLSKDRRWLKLKSTFLRLIDRRGIDELSCLLIATRSQEIKGDYWSAFHLKQIIQSLFIELAYLDRFKPVVLPLYKEVHDLFIYGIYLHKGKEGEIIELMKWIGPLDYEHMAKRLKNVISNKDPPNQYSHILKANRPEQG